MRVLARRLLLLIACGLPLFANGASPRILVLTDMGADPDDEQSFVRLLLYANQIEIEGIIATTSCWQQRNIRPDFIPTILDACGSRDPGGDSVSFLWSHYPEAGSCKQTITTSGAENADRFHVTAPKLDQEANLHVILRVSDKGTPALSCYQRVSVTVFP